MQRPSPRVPNVLLSLGFVLGCASSEPGSGTSGDASKGNDKPRVCTEMACFDSAVITTKLSALGAPTGTHSFALEVDGAPQTCTVTFGTITETAFGECSGGASLMFGPEMKSIESSGDGAVSVSFEPIPGQFTWQLSIQGTPGRVKVVHTFDGRPIVDQIAEFPTYTENRPNGPGCEPVCKAASVEWKGP